MVKHKKNNNKTQAKGGGDKIPAQARGGAENMKKYRIRAIGEHGATASEYYTDDRGEAIKMFTEYGEAYGATLYKSLYNIIITDMEKYETIAIKTICNIIIKDI